MAERKQPEISEIPEKTDSEASNSPVESPASSDGDDVTTLAFFYNGHLVFVDTMEQGGIRLAFFTDDPFDTEKVFFITTLRRKFASIVNADVKQNVAQIIRTASKAEVKEQLLDLQRKNGEVLFQEALDRVDGDQLRGDLTAAFDESDEPGFKKLLGSSGLSEGLKKNFYGAYACAYSPQLPKSNKLHVELARIHFGLWYVDGDYRLEFYQALEKFVAEAKGAFLLRPIIAAGEVEYYAYKEADWQKRNILANMPQTGEEVKAEKERVKKENELQAKELISSIQKLITEEEQHRKAIEHRETKQKHCDASLGS